MPSAESGRSLHRPLHRAAFLASRAGISVVSEDLDAVERKLGSRERAQGAIERLVRSERVAQVRRNLLVLPDATGSTTASLLELVDVITPRPYLITGGRALEEHGLTDQHHFAISVLVPRPTTPLAWRGETARFLLSESDRIWGGEPVAPLGEARPGPVIATPERAILDAISLTRYGVSLSQAIAALRQSLDADTGFSEKLFAAARRCGSASTARRSGLLLEMLAGSEAAEPGSPRGQPRRSRCGHAGLRTTDDRGTPVKRVPRPAGLQGWIRPSPRVGDNSVQQGHRCHSRRPAEAQVRSRTGIVVEHQRDRLYRLEKLLGRSSRRAGA